MSDEPLYFNCPIHGVQPSFSYCDQCEFEREWSNTDTCVDPYDRIPFGDAQRWEDEQVFNDLAAERDADWNEYSAEHPDDDHEEFPSDFQEE